MKVVILAGGFGTRLSEETDVRPKPMVEIGGFPILWHIMQQYLKQGFIDFFVALGYKGDFIKRYFVDYHVMSRDMKIAVTDGHLEIFDGPAKEWNVNLIDTGLHSNTGGRLKRLEEYLTNETFMLTYGDGVSNVDLRALLSYHQSHGKIATITAVRPPARFGGLDLQGDRVVNFVEKSQIREGWINGGFMVFEPGIFRYLEGDHTILESHTLECLAQEGQLYAYRHEDFWQCMDTLRDKRYLEAMWQQGNAPWKIW